jgi:hypothetical protein
LIAWSWPQQQPQHVRKNGFPGTLYTPLAIITDFFSGWVPPRHLYTSDIYKVWGNLPYNTGDYQIHLLFSMLFPGYENSGFYRDERGFLSPAPYGEIADVLLSDVRYEVLNRYSTIIITEGTNLDLELYLKLKRFIIDGGHVILFIGTVLKNAETSRYIGGEDYFKLFAADNTKSCITENNIGRGKVTVINDINTLERRETEIILHNNINEDIPHPYKFKPVIEEYLSKTFEDLKIISADNRVLQFTLDIINENEYTLFVSNNTLNTEMFNIISSAGRIISVTELDISDETDTRPEFLPRGSSGTGMPYKTDGEYTIKPYKCRIFRIKTESISLDQAPESYPEPRNKNLYLSLGYTEKSAKEYLLYNPTFLHHFGGLMLPAEYFDRLDETAAEREAHYLNLQNVSIIVDFTHMINHYPDFTIIGNFPNRTQASIERIDHIMALASKYRCGGAVFSLQRNAENEYDHIQAKNGAIGSLRKINDICNGFKIKAFVQNRNILISTAEQLKLFSEDSSVGSVAFNTAYALAAGADIDFKKYDTSLLLLSDIKTDIYGQKYAVNAPVYSGENSRRLKESYRQAKESGIPVILCAEYKCKNEITEELNFLND